MKDYSLYIKADTGDKNFPIRAFFRPSQSEGIAFSSHWHEQMEILYIIKGKAIVECNANSIEAVPGDVIIINSNDLHCGYCVEKPLEYDCIMFDSSLLKGFFDGICDNKYLTLIDQNLILFENKISNDPKIYTVIQEIVDEYEQKLYGYELYIKSLVYLILGILFRRYVKKMLTDKEYKNHSLNQQRLNTVLDYIEENLTDAIEIDDLANMVCISKYHFHHLFKKCTGRSIGEYINIMRLNQAELMLKHTDKSVTEVALASGFNDANYFSRMFKRYKKLSPSALRKVSENEQTASFG